MPFTGEPLGHVELKQKTSLSTKFRDIATFMILVLLFLDFRGTHNVQETQAGGIIRGYILRAVICDQAKAIGSSEPQHCNDSEIQEYRDKTIVPGSTAGARASKRTLAIVCAMYAQDHPKVNVEALCSSS